MSAALADQVAASIAGQAAADRVLEQLRGGCQHPDTLHAVLMKVRADHGTAGLLGAHRRIAKVLERYL